MNAPQTKAELEAKKARDDYKQGMGENNPTAIAASREVMEIAFQWNLMQHTQIALEEVVQDVEQMKQQKEQEHQ